MSDENPYRPPGAAVAEVEDAAIPALAGRGQRFVAALIDSLINAALAIPLMLALGVFDYGKRGFVPFPLLIGMQVVLFVAFILIHGYWLRKNGQTVGKKIVGIRIADLAGDVPGFGRVLFLRYLPVWLVAAIPAVGQAAPLVDALFIFRSDRRCVHDLIAGTQVVNA
jgi:uncharacterized RDD family membrane protein YckC